MGAMRTVGTMGTVGAVRPVRAVLREDARGLFTYYAGQQGAIQVVALLLDHLVFHRRQKPTKMPLPRWEFPSEFS